MKVPTIHNNGTSGEALLEQACDAGASVANALRVMRAAAPNARDYYVQGPDAFREAVAEHQSRVDRIAVVAREYEQLAIAVSEAIDARTR